MNRRNCKQPVFTIPNLLSLVRLGLIPVMVWLYCWEENFLRTGYVLLLSGATDILDGFIARRFHMISDLGKILDPLADKLTQGIMLICLLLRYPLMAWPLALMVLKEAFMVITGILVIQKTGQVLGANWHGKAATCLLYGTMFLHVFWNRIPAVLSQASIFLCCGMIALSLILYGLRNLQTLLR